jgi:hypothetical protein
MVIGASLWGLVSDAGGGVNVLRLFRAIRVLKLVSATLRKGLERLVREKDQHKGAGRCETIRQVSHASGCEDHQLLGIHL